MSAASSQKKERSTMSWIGPDFVGGTMTALSITPFILTIDKAVCDASVKRFTMSQSLKMGVTQMFTQPHLYVSQKAFGFVWGIYIATYFSANLGDSYAKNNGMDPFYPKLFAAVAVNIPLSVCQDKFFANWFGAGPKKLPMGLNLGSYAIWALRDCTTMAGSFSFPAKVAPIFEEKLGMGPSEAKSAAQIFCPTFAAAVIHPPLHLIGLDMRNRPEVAFRDRIPLIRSLLLKTSLMRVSRILPAFGIGGIVNSKCREYTKPMFD